MNLSSAPELDQPLFATTQKGLERFLEKELIALGASWTRQTVAGVSFAGDFAFGMKACLHLRCASRVYYPLASFIATSANDIYREAEKLDWPKMMGSDVSFAVRCELRSEMRDSSRFCALRVKDAVVDRFRNQMIPRPNVDPKKPDFGLYLFIKHKEAVLYLDMAGESLHRRGYRQVDVEAPMKEHLASGLLMAMGWPEEYDEQAWFVDPMCGGGTLVMEAALMAAKFAPGLLRERFGFMGAAWFDPEVWKSMVEQARQEVDKERIKDKFFGFDASLPAVASAKINLEKTEFEELIEFKNVSLSELQQAKDWPQDQGLALCNPPYGVRLGSADSLKKLYSELGQSLKDSFPHWRAGVFLQDEAMARQLGIKAEKRMNFFNGSLACKLFSLRLDEQAFYDPSTPAPLGKGGQMLLNRLKKNKDKLKAYLKKHDIQCYRLYDRDLPEYACSIDIYGEIAHISEYAAPKTIDPGKARSRIKEVDRVLERLFEDGLKERHFKLKQRQKGSSQYAKLESKKSFYEVKEGGHKFLLNFTDYLDCGLFLDHRLTRKLIGTLAKGKSMLNLYCYTASASVYAAANRAGTTNVDSSNTYLNWGKENFRLNGLNPDSHGWIRQDSLDFLRKAKIKWDLIFIDPPTFSNRKDQGLVFEVEEDHVELLKLAAKKLKPGGSIIFSTNKRRFKLDEKSLEQFEIRDLNRELLPKDFERHPHVHWVWEIKNR